MKVTQWIKFSDLKLRQIHQAKTRFPHAKPECFNDFTWGVDVEGNVEARMDDEGTIENFTEQ